MLADVQFEEREGSPVAHIRGEVDMSNAGELSMALQSSVVQSAAGLVIDFTETEYLDSAGLHFIFDLGKRVLDIVSVDSLAPRCETLELALDQLRAHAADIPPA